MGVQSGGITRVVTMVLVIGILGSGLFGAGIRAVAERIEDVLQVVQEPEGTEVTRVSGADREAFVVEEVEERLLA